jgi:nucleoside-diphosphate-sugar epimerase
LPDSVTVVLDNVDELSDQEILELVDGCDALAYGGGADGRNTFPPPAISGYRKANVDPILRMVPLLKRAGVPRLVILGSYYTALDRVFPELRMAERHPYITSRSEQAEVAFELAGDELAVAILELPYVFGAAPNRGTLWGGIVKHVQEAEVVTAPAGGTACVTARQVGWAVAAACERVKGHKHYAIVEDNLTYRRIYGLIAVALDLERTFEIIPLEKTLAAAREQATRMSSATRVGGYDPVGMAEMQATLLYLDPMPAREALGFGHDDTAQAIRDTVMASLEYD